MHKTVNSYKQAASIATWFVQREIYAGNLPYLKLANITCVDCGLRAICYDHRDYAEPLKVVPVCISCNGRRGNADWKPMSFLITPKPRPKKMRPLEGFIPRGEYKKRR